MEGSLYVSVESGDASASEVNLNLESVSTFRAGCVTGDFLNSGIKSKLEFVFFKVWGFESRYKSNHDPASFTRSAHGLIS